MAVRYVRFLFIVKLLLLAPVQAANAESVLYCFDVLSTGFSKSDGTWETADFEKTRFTVKVIGDWEGLVHQEEEYSCFDGGEFEGFHPIICKNTAPWLSNTFNFDKSSLRYVYSSVSIGGYASSGITDPDTDNLQAGDCETF